jgi:acyl-CoA thioester hydrolase
MNGTRETYRGVVYPWQCDHVGHMNVMWYTGKFDEATWNLFASIGVTPGYLRERERGMAAVEQKTTYLKELLPGDVVFVRSDVLELREKVIRFVHEMVNEESQTVVARTELTAVHLDRKTRRACPFPEDIAERGRACIAEAPGPA